MGVFDYVNTNAKNYIDLLTALAGGTPGASGAPFVNTNPKPYADAEFAEVGGSTGSGYANTHSLSYINTGAQTIDPPDPVDTTPPATTINSGPTGTTTDNTPTFTFSANELSTFETKMDAGAWTPGTSPKTYAALANGAHTFQVRATDAAGNVDATPATRSFTISSISSSLPPAGMSLLWTGDGVGDWDATLIEDAPGASITNGTYGGSAGAIRFNMPTPSSASGDRVELQKTGWDPDGEYYYTWEFYVPSTVVIDSGDSDGYVTFNQFHGNENAGYTGGFGIMRSPANQIRVRVEGGYRIDSNDYEHESELVVGTITRNAWHRIGYHIKWDMSYAGIHPNSTDENPDGFAIAYLNGAEGVRLTGVPTMGDKRTGAGRVSGTGPTDNVMFRLGWYPQVVGSSGLELYVRNVEVWG